LEERTKELLFFKNARQAVRAFTRSWMFFRFSSLSAIALGFASGGRLQPRAARKNVGLFGI
jgi:Na+/H+-dicarboxylate symporter